MSISGSSELPRRWPKSLMGARKRYCPSLRKAAAAGLLHDDREAVEMEKVCDSIEHSRFTYNWAHVMLTTRVLDALKTFSSQLVEFRPKGTYYERELLRLRSRVRRSLRDRILEMPIWRCIP